MKLWRQIVKKHKVDHVVSYQNINENRTESELNNLSGDSQQKIIGLFIQTIESERSLFEADLYNLFNQEVAMPHLIEGFNDENLKKIQQRLQFEDVKTLLIQELFAKNFKMKFICFEAKQRMIHLLQTKESSSENNEKNHIDNSSKKRKNTVLDNTERSLPSEEKSSSFSSDASLKINPLYLSSNQFPTIVKEQNN